MRSCAHCVCVCLREREGHITAHQLSYTRLVCVCVCVCVCVRKWERDRVTYHSRVYSASEIALITVFLQIHTSIITVCYATLCPSRAGTDGKTKDIINCLYLHWKLKLATMERGVALPTRLVVFGQSQCTVPVGQSEGLCRKLSVWERRGIKDLQCTVFET